MLCDFFFPNIFVNCFNGIFCFWQLAKYETSINLVRQFFYLYSSNCECKPIPLSKRSEKRKICPFVCQMLTRGELFIPCKWFWRITGKYLQFCSLRKRTDFCVQIRVVTRCNRSKVGIIIQYLKLNFGAVVLLIGC